MQYETNCINIDVTSAPFDVVNFSCKPGSANAVGFLLLVQEENLER